MASHGQLLEHIPQMLNLEQQYFEVGAHILTMEVEDIYFLTGLSRRGAPISLTGSRGGDITTREFIDCDCSPKTRALGKKIPSRVARFVSRNISPSADRSCSSGLNGSNPE